MSARPFNPAPKPSQKATAKKAGRKPSAAAVVMLDLPAIGSTVHHTTHGEGVVQDQTPKGKILVQWQGGQSTWIQGISRSLIAAPVTEEHKQAEDAACAAEHTAEDASVSCLDTATAETMEAPQNAEPADQEPEMTATTTTAKTAPVIDDLGYDRAAIAAAEAAVPIGSEVKHRKNGAGTVGGYSKGGKLQIRWAASGSISYVEHTSKTLTAIIRPEELAAAEDQAAEEAAVVVVPEAGTDAETQEVERPAEEPKAKKARKAKVEPQTPALHLSGTIGELVEATKIAGSPKTIKETRRRHSTHVAPLVDHRPASELSPELVAEAVIALIAKGVKAITATSQVGLLVRAAKSAGIAVDGWRKLVTDAA